MKLKQQDILDYLEKYPGATEGQIQVGAWGYMRNTSWGSNARYAKILRRCLRAKRIKRIKLKDKEEYNKFVYRYCLESQSFDVIFSQIRK
jgi:hypothetical protein